MCEFSKKLVKRMKKNLKRLTYKKISKENKRVQNYKIK